MSDPIERAIVDEQVIARTNEYYYRHKADRARRWDLWLRLFVTILGTGALASVGNLLPHLWQVLTAAAAICALISPMLQLPETMVKSSMLALRWSDIAARLLMLTHEPMERRAGQLAEICNARGRLECDDIERRNDKLTERLFAQVKRELSDRLSATN